MIDSVPWQISANPATCGFDQQDLSNTQSTQLLINNPDIALHIIL